MNVWDKLRLLSDAAKYDAACTSSGVDKRAPRNGIGSAAASGICHSFSADGRCISLLKVLFTNSCVFDCKYCVNARSRDARRTAFTPRELADLTIEFYRRNYIEGLFLSSGVLRDPDYTMEQLIAVLTILRREYRFSGYIHAKTIPGSSPELIDRLGRLADRISVNIEMPSQASLNLLAPDKSKLSILQPMRHISGSIRENRHDVVQYRNAPRFAPAGQSTQMIIGATADNDRTILTLTENLYRRYQLKRVFYSAYIPVTTAAVLPPPGTPPPLWREHRLYQADWLLRFYGFAADELLGAENPNFNPYLDPKCYWALHNQAAFPLEINTAAPEMLLRVPGIGNKSVWRIVKARRNGALDFDSLTKLGVVMKRAQHFITCRGKMRSGLLRTRDSMLADLLSVREAKLYRREAGCSVRQLSLFDERETVNPLQEVLKCLPLSI